MQSGTLVASITSNFLWYISAMFSKTYLFLLLLSWKLASILPLCAASYIGTNVLNIDWYGNLSCGSVPYPFGTAGTALPGFEVCPGADPSTAVDPFLSIANTTYNIGEISLQGYVKIYVGAIQKKCRNPNGTWEQPEMPRVFNLEGTPFTLSDQNNVLTVVGCNNLVQITNAQDTNLTSGCVTFCNPYNDLLSAACSGLGCCQATLPGPLKSFDLQFKALTDHLYNCSTVFFSPRDAFQSQDSQVFYNSSNDPYSHGDNLVQLDWAIGSKSCEVAMNNISSFACKNNSYCYDSPLVPGYLCNCSQGYEGNPYAEDGCTDIDECLEPDSYPCVYGGHCINLLGNYTCSCPARMTGDGRKGGTGCTRVDFPLDIVLGAGLGLLFILVVSGTFTYWGLQKRRIVKMRSQFFRQNGGYLLKQRLASQGIDSAAKVFTENELKRATENYNHSKILGQGGYGTVYKGTLSDFKLVAIKRSRIEDESQIESFINEIALLSQINHKNVVKLLGCCLETQVPLLVYEFIPNGTLSRLIHSQNSDFHLPWDCRLRISAEAACAIAYLHSAASFPIIHRDIKSSNILLDKNLTAKVSDFGASRSVPFDKTHLTTLVQGTIGYLDPEYFQSSQLTAKSDVYSFGVVLAELLTGEKPISFARPEEFHNLAMYFTAAFDEGRLREVIDAPVAEEAGAEELNVIAHLTRRCLNTKGEERPTMKEVAGELDALKRMRQIHKGKGYIQQYI